MAVKVLGGLQCTALAAAMVLFAGVATGGQQAQAAEIKAPIVVEIAASPASAALAAHCGGGTRSVFRTQRAWLDHLVRNARNLTGRTFQQDLVDCATALPNAGSDGYSGLVQLGQVCEDLRASADTCRFVRLQKNLFITIGN